MKDVLDRIDGVVIGTLAGLERGVPHVTHSGSPEGPAPARSLVTLDAADVGAEIALLFEAGDPSRPLILGRIVEPGQPRPEVIRDGERVRVTAVERIELRCGKGSIIMEADGHITIRGTYLVSHASAANRIRGGSVNLN
jgi:Domain of unknown function (DUF6484)